MKIDNFTKTISWLETIEVSQQRPGTSESYLPFSFISIEPIHLDLPNFLQNVAIPYWISANLRNENISDIEEFDWIAFHARSSKAIVWCSIVSIGIFLHWQIILLQYRVTQCTPIRLIWMVSSQSIASNSKFH